MPKILGIEEHVQFVLPGDLRVKAQFEPGRSTEEKTSAVHYTKFHFSPEARAAFLDSEGDVYLEVDMPEYAERTRLHPEVRRALAADFS